ncbi:MAG: energy-coupling factor ABC transporter permease [Eubacteriales bacterium]
MHMADALITPAVGGVMLAAAAGVAAYSAKKATNGFEESKIPVMGVAGAFVFAAQMINFSIPGTGSSGHIAGALLLAILLGPYAAYLTLGAVLLIQALFFADGGLLAFGCNWINMGFFTCFLAFPLIYKTITSRDSGRLRTVLACVAASTAGLLVGAFSVTIQTTLSGITELPFNVFAAYMLGIHLPIGIIEGLITAAVVLFVKSARPELLDRGTEGHGLSSRLTAIISLTGVAVVGGIASSFASSHPDGLEWSVEKTGAALDGATDGITTALASLQEKLAFMPDYGFKDFSASLGAVDAGTSAAGIIGAVIVLALALIIGFAVRKRPRKSEK